jgi:hypothetical protein
VPGEFGYFAREVLEVCGFEVGGMETVGDFVRVAAKGMELGMLFGMLNGIAALRRFSGTCCIRYLNGSWGGPLEAMTRFQQDAERSLGKVKKLIGMAASAEQRKEVYRTQSRLFHVIGEVRSRLVHPD